MPLVSAYVLHTASPAQHTELRPGPQLLAAGQQEVPAHATLLGHACGVRLGLSVKGQALEKDSHAMAAPDIRDVGAESPLGLMESAVPSADASITKHGKDR
jgi:hypothetical protein